MRSLKLSDLPVDPDITALSLEGKTQLYWLISSERHNPNVSEGLQMGQVLRPLNNLVECVFPGRPLAKHSSNLYEYLITGEKRK